MTFLTIAWAALANFIAYGKRFYRLPHSSSKMAPKVRLRDLFACFAIYLVLSRFLTPVLIQYLFIKVPELVEFRSFSISLLAFFQFLNMSAVFVLMQRYLRRRDMPVYKRIWKDRIADSESSVEFDLGIGALTWLLAFPTVAVLSDLFERLTKGLFGQYSSEQVAVQFVKEASNAPIALFLALVAVLFLAPLIEEFLFRGVLQTHLKQRIGPRSAILISSLTFALFHFSFGQGIGNIPLIFSLFMLGGYLGLLYEKQGSLWASIGLHMTFNTISALRILIFPES